MSIRPRDAGYGFFFYTSLSYSMAGSKFGLLYLGPFHSGTLSNPQKPQTQPVQGDTGRS
ncbi:hypothetical protein BDV59DRAFT_168813 [Aspergillus ambiguus]|uniref:uncharacterized protein n=1 Tax=Aspergillus ambiguus TaxID=176160 RepID=UPI003CCD8174